MKSVVHMGIPLQVTGLCSLSRGMSKGPTPIQKGWSRDMLLNTL